MDPSSDRCQELLIKIWLPGARGFSFVFFFVFFWGFLSLVRFFFGGVLRSGQKMLDFSLFLV